MSWVKSIETLPIGISGSWSLRPSMLGISDLILPSLYSFGSKGRQTPAYIPMIFFAERLMPTGRLRFFNKALSLLFVY